MPIIKNKLPSELVFLDDTEYAVSIPGATEEHDEEGRLVAVDGTAEVSDAVWDTLQDDEEAAPYIADGALYLYVPEPVAAAPEEQSGGAE
jgi:hypothetical protein